MADSREWASDPDASSFVNGHCEHDIEAVDYVQIEGVESVLQVLVPALSLARLLALCLSYARSCMC